MIETKNKILDSFYELINSGSKVNNLIIDKIAIVSSIQKEEIELIFPNGLIEIISSFLSRFGQNMLTRLEIDNDYIIIERTSQKIDYIVKTSLDNIEKDLYFFRQIFQSICLKNPIGGQKIIWNVVDSMWKFVGDKSNDWSFYSKRISLEILFFTSVKVLLISGNSNRAIDTYRAGFSGLSKIVKIKNKFFK